MIRVQNLRVISFVDIGEDLTMIHMPGYTSSASPNMPYFKRTSTFSPGLLRYFQISNFPRLYVHLQKVYFASIF